VDVLDVVSSLAGLVALVVGADGLVRGAAGLAERFGTPPLVVGLTVVAFGTSAPELAVTVGASLSGEADVALGNVVGSNLFNLLVVLGAGVAVSGSGIAVDPDVLRVDLPVLLAVQLIVVPMLWNGARV
jgi:cation:H+ antiporter